VVQTELRNVEVPPATVGKQSRGLPLHAVIQTGDVAADPRDASPAAAATGRVCDWCQGPIPARARRDAVCCSVRCRQARHRFTRDVGHARAVTGGRPLRLAYADPPYPGMAYLYRGHPDYAGEVDHAALIRRLADEYDGWALSTSAAALPAVLGMCPPGVRVASWHRGPRMTASKWPLHAWEPVIYHGGRPLYGPFRTDSLVCGVSPLTTLPSRVTGTKPAEFIRWVFELLGAQRGDTFDDLFPGSGVVGRAWQLYVAPGPGDASRAAAVTRAVPRAERDASPTSSATGGAS
jgi:hypothetical protein